MYVDRNQINHRQHLFDLFRRLDANESLDSDIEQSDGENDALNLDYQSKEENHYELENNLENGNPISLNFLLH